jgi:hypothetical protein
MVMMLEHVYKRDELVVLPNTTAGKHIFEIVDVDFIVIYCVVCILGVSNHDYFLFLARALTKY